MMMYPFLKNSIDLDPLASKNASWSSSCGDPESFFQNFDKVFILFLVD